MRALLFLLISSLFTLELPNVPLSTPEEIATLSADPNSLIEQLISPFSGQPVLRITDLIAKGAQEIAIQRTYVAPLILHPEMTGNDYRDFCSRMNAAYSLRQNYRGWSLYIPHVCMRISGDSVRYTDPSGVTLDLSLTKGSGWGKSFWEGR